MLTYFSAQNAIEGGAEGGSKIVSHELLKQLTKRQCELLDLVASGTKTSKELAHLTGLAAGTVDNALQQAAKILGASGREAAARRYRELKENSHNSSHMRISSFPTRSKPALSSFASAVWGGVKGVANFLRGPPFGGKEHKLRWDGIMLQILRVAVVGMVFVFGLVLFVLAFFKTFS